MKKKIVTIVGARPQFIKLAPLSKELRKSYNEVIIHTGQHYDYNMSKLFFDELNIPKPDYNLNINQGNHGQQTGQMLIEIEKVILQEKPDLVIVFGDTNSTLAGSLVASKLHIPQVHIEAGLRSFNKEMPEEINRIVTDSISEYLFVPTETGMNNLKSEGLANRAYFTGDIMLDAVLHFSKVAKEKSNIIKELELTDYYLATLHRPYNVDSKESLARILGMLGIVAGQVVFPIHPRTKGKIGKFGLVIPRNIKLIEPVGYLDMLSLQMNSIAVITDSGGIQKEAFFLKKKCYTVRSETEWVETLTDNWNTLITPDKIDNIDIGDSNTNLVEQKKYFGENVTDKMILLINKILQKQ